MSEENRASPEAAAGRTAHAPRAAGVVRRWRDPVVVQILRSTAAATISYAVALQLSDVEAPLTAPLTALLVVQVTLYATITTGVRRVNSVVIGVLIAVGFSSLVGLSWWSLALIILASLTVGQFVRVGEFVPEVAISAMLVLGVTQVGASAWDRVLETLIGAVVGLSFNFLLAPPVWVDTAGESIENLARRMRRLLLRGGEQLITPTAPEQAEQRLFEARQLDDDVADVDAALRQAEDSLRLNPRVREGLLNRVVLRTGLDTLEICVVVVRVLSRTFTDLSRERPHEPLLPRGTGAALQETLDHIADAVVSFAVLVTTQVSTNADAAEARLAEELSAAVASRDRAARLLLDDVREDPRGWQLHGALLTEVDRLLDELDMEHRSRRLMEELDRSAREQRQRFSWLGRLRSLFPGGGGSRGGERG
ncbi:aromatic acid exporter family protein [Streptomyces uncialis]|uniref:FUSC family protein n=1 Tax=Streptomyces uncialis TaxID=1048205 RepID=UPI0022545E31|nr:aromatic acid exporter family protein [Streptomyces uncialis]MCX4662358.1 aromatic acid exporter family protein [Streptomyces uncialis]WTE09603.1 aromatic acid exporter family protein [Streptomyces uncialis]